jgi:hypothetical protein
VGFGGRMTLSSDRIYLYREINMKMWAELNFLLNIISIIISAGNDNFIAVSIEGKSINRALLHQCHIHVMHRNDHNGTRFSLGSLNKHQRILKLKDMIKLGTKLDRTKGIEFSIQRKWLTQNIN